MSKTIVLIILCHLMGDYVLQCDFIAQTKGKNWYHLFVHCALYCVPLLAVFGWTWQLAVIFISHLIIDPLKAGGIRLHTRKTKYYIILSGLRIYYD